MANFWCPKFISSCRSSQTANLRSLSVPGKLLHAALCSPLYPHNFLHPYTEASIEITHTSSHKRHFMQCSLSPATRYALAEATSRRPKILLFQMHTYPYIVVIITRAGNTTKCILSLKDSIQNNMIKEENTLPDLLKHLIKTKNSLKIQLTFWHHFPLDRKY